MAATTAEAISDCVEAYQDVRLTQTCGERERETPRRFTSSTAKNLLLHAFLLLNKTWVSQNVKLAAIAAAILITGPPNWQSMMETKY